MKTLKLIAYLKVLIVLSLCCSPSQVNVSNIILNENDIKLSVGDEFTLVANLYPENITESQTIKWASSDEKVCTVSQGVVTAVGVGSAEVIATAGSASAKCLVQVGSIKFKNKVVLNRDGFYVRTAYNSKDDIIIKYIYDVNGGQITPTKAYMGVNSLSDEQILSTPFVHDTYDSTGPVWMPEYWYLGQQHGYEVCRIIATHDKTQEDVGSIWKDNLGREFTLGKVEGSSLYFLPKIIIGSPEGKDIRTWKVPQDNDKITSMMHVSGAIHTKTVNQISSKPRFNYRPFQKVVNRRYLADGKEITSSNTIIYCNVFIVSETIKVINPTKVTQWFPDVKHVNKGWEMFEIDQAFCFTGLGTAVNTVLNVKYPLNFTHYGANQARTLVPVRGFNSFTIIPKTKPIQFAGAFTDFRKEVNTSDYKNNSGIQFYRDESSVQDINNLPDRIISYLRNSKGDYLLGFASGLSLVTGITKKEERVKYIPKGNLYCNQALRFSPSQKNKFYVRAIEGDAFPDRLLPRGTYEVNYYFSYFDPSAQKNKVYWYKDGDNYLVYIHSFDRQENAEILLPTEMDDFSVEIIEKTTATTLLNNVVKNGMLNVSFTDDAANYLVLLLKN
ncbi:MAG: hypothetical protein GX361_01280 [Bacteroidales bacterium]|nr:hypothetical protein [Bacteroidales bacterium]